MKNFLTIIIGIFLGVIITKSCSCMVDPTDVEPSAFKVCSFSKPSYEYWISENEMLFWEQP